FELPTANVFQILALGSGGRGLVEIDWHLIALPDLLADLTSHGDAIFDGHAFDWYKRHHVGRSHAGMRALVLVEVNQLRSLTHTANGSLLDGLAIAHESNDTAVMVGVHLTVEKENAVDFHSVNDGIDFGLVSAFREVGDTFDQGSGHNRKEYKAASCTATQAL